MGGGRGENDKGGMIRGKWGIREGGSQEEEDGRTE